MEVGAMARRLLLALGCVLFLAAPASGGDIYHRKRAVDERLSSLHSKIAGAHDRATALTQQIRVANVKIDAVASDVAHAQTQLAVLQAQLEASRRNLERLNALVAKQTTRLRSLKRQYRVALGRLNERIVDAYETPDPDAVDVLLSATTMSELIDRVEYLSQIGTQDSRITKQLDTARDELHSLRERTRANRKHVAEETAAVRARTEEQQTVTEQLIASQQQLAAARESQQSALSSTKTTEQELVHESQLLANQSAALAESHPCGSGGRRCGRCARAAAPPRAAGRDFVRLAAGRSKQPDPQPEAGAVVLGSDLARPGADREPVRGALPRERRLLVPSRHRHRVRKRNADPRSRLGNRDLRRLDGAATAISPSSTTEEGSRPRYGHQSSIAVGLGAARVAGQRHRLRRLHGLLLRAAPPLRGAGQR